MSALICPLCENEIKPGDQCDMIGPKAKTHSRIQPVVNNSLQAVHWACAHPEDPDDTKEG